MSESLGDILQKRGRAAKEPEEFTIIRKFVQDKYSVTPKLGTSKAAITITVPNAGIAGNLRFDLYDLNQLLSNPRRLVVRIGR